MNKLKLTRVLIPIKQTGEFSKGDLIYWEGAEPKYQIADHDAYSSCWYVLMFLLVSDREIKEGDSYAFDMSVLTDNKEDIEIMMCNDEAEAARCNDKTTEIGKASKRIESAYPALEGLPPISPEFMKIYCENPDGEIRCEMDDVCKCLEIPCICHGTFFSEPRLESGFIALEMGSKVVSDYTVNEYLANDDKWVKESQDKPADAHTPEGEILDIFSKMSDTPSKPADVPSEVMNFPEWFKSNYKGQSHHDFAQNRLCTEYARYYHTTLSQQPERKVSTDAEQAFVEWWKTQEVSDPRDGFYAGYKVAMQFQQSEISRLKFQISSLEGMLEDYKEGCYSKSQSPAYKQADKVVDWKQLEIDFRIECTAYNGVGRNISTQIINFFKSRLSTSGVSDEKVACEFGHWLGLCTEFQNGQLFLMRTDIGYELPATEITFEDAFKLFKSPTA